ncbi:reverse transcriptase domain-containing protein [Tanacetum coccineum]
MGGQTRPRNYQYPGSPQKKSFIQRYCPPSKTAKQLEDIHNFKQEGDESLYQAWERYNDLLYKCPTYELNSHQKGPIPEMTPAQALTIIQTMADHSQKWHDETTSRNTGSSSSNDGLDALVGCQICEGPHLEKDCPLNEEVKQVKEVRYGEFGRTMPFNGSNGGKFCVGPPGYYTKIDSRRLYGERRQNLEELLAKHQEEFAQRSTEMEVWIKKLQENAEINTRNQSTSLKNLETQIKQLTKEIHSNKTPNSSSGQIKIVTANQETIRPNKLHGVSFISETKSDTPDALQHLPPKELNPGSFTLPCKIDKFNFYSMADLGASINVMPKSIFEHLLLTNLKKTNMLYEMADMSKKAPLGIVKNVLVKIDKFLFPSDFVIIDNTPSETKILGRPVLATIHAEIDVFARKFSLGINEDRIIFDIMRKDHNYMNPSMVNSGLINRPQSPS